jgi:AcrR family transcriptional regulator
LSTPSAKRRYDNQSRAEEAQARRRRIVAEAHRQFLANGYAATSIEGVATAAGVSVQTIYAVFVSKPGLLARVIDVAIGGDDEDVMVRDRPEFQAILAKPDRHALLRAAVAHGRSIHERSGPLLHLLDTVSGSDPALAELAADHRRQAREESTFLIDQFPAAWFRPEITREERIAAVFLLGYHQTWWTLTQELGWSARRYDALLVKLLGSMFTDG